MLAIPYLRHTLSGEWKVVAMRFRSIDPTGQTKYLQPEGSTTRLFNTVDAANQEDTIALCEGELDAITASVNGIPAVGVAGVQAWKKHYTEIFLGYRAVYVLADGDDPGRSFAAMLSQLLGNVTIVQLPDGEDVNSITVSGKIGWIKERLH